MLIETMKCTVYPVGGTTSFCYKEAIPR